MDADDLIAIEEIKQLKARYFRLMDTKRWDEMRTLFTDDSEISGRPPDIFIDDTRSHLAEAVTVHHGHMPEIRITGQGTARGVWSMFDFLQWPDRQLIGYGHYEEEYRREPAGWRFTFLRLTRLRVDPPRPDLARLSATFLDRGRPSH